MNKTAEILKENMDRMDGYRIECPLCYKIIKADDAFKACPSPSDSTSDRLVFYHIDCFERLFGKKR